jgi:hypothetical protein
MLDRVLRLWASPPPPGEQALADFRAVYSDPLLLNGSRVFVEELVFRARVLHAAFVELQLEVLTTVEAPGRTVVVFRQRGLHVGRLPTPLGDLEATRRVAEILAIDVLTVENDLITEVWAMGDELGRLMQLEALLSLAPQTAGPPDPPIDPPDMAE